MKGREMDDPILIVPDEILAKMVAPPQGYKLPTGYLSYSQIEMYLRCAKQYEFRYIHDEKRPPGVSLAMGKSAHHALETTHNHIVDHDIPASDELLSSAFSDGWDAAAKEVPEESWKDEGIDQGLMKDVGLRLVRQYNARMAPTVKPLVKNGVRGIEKKFEVKVNDIPILGYIDLIDTNHAGTFTPEEQSLMTAKGVNVPSALCTAIADFKVKAKSMTAGEVNGSLQMTIYSYAEGIPLVRYDQLLKTKTPSLKRIASMRTQQDHLWMKEVVTGVAHAINAGAFPACDPTAWVCGPKWCGWFSVCRGKKR